jgi:Protein of unknown function (DUF1579)
MLRAMLLVGFVGFAGLAGSQPPKSDDKKDPQAKFEPRSKPGEGQKFLEQFVGDWDVVKSFHPRNGEPVKGKGECRQRMIQDGRFLQSEFTFANDAGKTAGTGTGLIGFEPENGKFTSVWIDSRQTRMSFRQSEEKFDGKQIALVGKELGEAGKEGGRKSRTVTTLTNEGKTITHLQFSVEAGAPDRLVMELVLTKKAEPQPPGKKE